LRHRGYARLHSENDSSDSLCVFYTTTRYQIPEDNNFQFLKIVVGKCATMWFDLTWPSMGFGDKPVWTR